VVLGNSPWHLVRLHITEIVAAINAATPGSYVEVEIPLRPKPPFVRSQGDPSKPNPLDEIARRLSTSVLIEPGGADGAGGVAEGRSEGSVVQAQFGEGLAGDEFIVVDDVVAGNGSG